MISTGMYAAAPCATAPTNWAARYTPPTSIAMAAAVCRTMAPSPTPSRPIRLKLAPASTTARSTPGWDSDGAAMPCRSAAPPAANEMNDAASPAPSATTPNTAAFAASTSGRPGTAARVARIIPEVYSLVIISTPRTPVSSSPGTTPASALLVRSPAPFLVLVPIRMAMAVAPAAVIASVHQVERRVRSLIHSIRATCRNR